ncbi:MAG: LysE family translocator [Alphaproteobacteria bacterium]
MTLQLWIAFVLASGVLLVIPGPTVLLVIGYALSDGRRSALSVVTGVALGDFVAMTLSVIGLGALLAASATAFTVLKWVGAIYLVYLGIMMWRRPPQLTANLAAQPRSSDLAKLGHAFAVTVLNPKSIAFFVAFVPQFLTPTAPLSAQLPVLVVTFVSLAAASSFAFAMAAGTLRERIREPRILRAINRIGGSVLIGAGIATAALRRSG